MDERYLRKLGDALRRSHALAAGGDVRALLGWDKLQDSERRRWLDYAAAAVHYGVYCDTEMAA